MACQTAGHHQQEDTGGSSEGPTTKLSEHYFTFTFTFTFVTVLLPNPFFLSVPGLCYL
jgi:hypothetical protein